MKKFAVTKGRSIALICCTLLPLMAIAFGILYLTKGVIVNTGFAVSLIIIPLIAIGLLAVCVFSGMKPLPKVILCIIILILFLNICFFAFFISEFVALKHYDGIEAEQKYVLDLKTHTPMPELSQVGQYSAVEYHNVLISCAIFSAETDYLICCYTPEEYEIQKAALDQKYIFQSEPVDNMYHEIHCEPSAELDGYQFRLLSVEDYKTELDFPMEFVLIGCSDETQEIVYVSFSDFDLDYIISLEEFIANDCGWKYIR